MANVGMNKDPAGTSNDDCLSVTIKAVGEQKMIENKIEQWYPYSISYTNQFIVYPPKEPGYDSSKNQYESYCMTHTV